VFPKFIIAIEIGGGKAIGNGILKQTTRVALRLFGIVVFLRLDRVAYAIVNANHCNCDGL
jgi:hypothetical protein